jgi:long-chain acyl-CoA synthetase
MNLATILAEAAAEHRRRPALLLESGTMTREELEARSIAVASCLRQYGIDLDDPVAIMLPNGPEFVATLLAVWRVGAVAVPLNILLAPPEVEARLSLSGARLLVDGEFCQNPAPNNRPEVTERGSSDVAAILFTSGTSGIPKGTMLTHGNIRAAALGAADAMAFGPGDVVLGSAPFAHVLGLSTGLVGTLARGAALAVEPRFDAERTLERMTSTRTTILLGVPTMSIALCQAARTAKVLPPLRLAHIGGAAVPNEVADDFERTFDAELVEGYGLTEMSGVATTYQQGDRRRPGSVGRPLAGTEMRLAETDDQKIGEVQFRGPSVVAGYWENAEATAHAISPDGWLSTGDVGRLDAVGYLYLEDRKKELVIRGGYNVYPREVEEVLFAHPDVLEVAVIGLPHEMLGEEVAAVVVRRPGGSAGVEELQAWTKERLAVYKYPRVIAFVDELPKGPTGKILKRSIDRDALRT